MNTTQLPSECPNCGNQNGPEPVAEHIRRCPNCAFITPEPLLNTELSDHQARVTRALAPDGVLRGKYRIIAQLGEGAHGVAYLAKHEYFKHLCVVKVLRHHTGETSDTAISRLRGEARVGFRVHDPNVVRVLDCDVVRDTWYFVMEFVEGIDLGALCRHGLRLPWQQAVQLAIDAARGLAAIHGVGLVHRDIKPSNLILGTDGHVRVADLGVATLAEDGADAGHSVAGDMAGTLAYTAPEAFDPTVPVGPRADLYSLGVTLYQLLTGGLPHHGSTVFQQIIDVQCRPAEWPDDTVTNVPPWFIDTILQLLSIDPDERIDSAAALAEKLTAPGDAPRVVAPTPRAERLEPRGIGVLPFENERGTLDDDWLGYALSNYVGRALSQIPGVYFADQDGLIALTRRLEGEGVHDLQERLTSAGRMVGAGTIVTGHYHLENGALRVRAAVLRARSGATRPAAQVQGQLTDLDNLQHQLMEQLLAALDFSAAAPARPPTAAPSHVLAARERLVLARQAVLRGDYEQGIALAEEAVTLDPDYAEAVGYSGTCYARVGNYEAAEARHRKQEAMATQSGEGRLLIEALANLGVMNYFRGEYQAAEAFYQRALQRARELRLAVEEAQICNNLGFVLYRRGRHAEAEEAFQRAIETHKAYGGLTSLIGPYNGMGNVLLEQKRHPEARQYYRHALALATEVGDRTSVGTTRMHLGRCAALEGHFAEAKHELTMALNVLEETRFWNGLARAYEYIAEMNLQLGDAEEAMRCADKRVELARQHANQRMESAAWLQKAEALKLLGRVKDAEECLERGRRLEATASAAS